MPAKISDHISDNALSTAKPLAKPAKATHILIQTEGANIRFRLDGSDPTASVGFLLTTLEGPRAIEVGSNEELRVIQVAATATIQYMWRIYP